MNDILVLVKKLVTTNTGFIYQSNIDLYSIKE